MAAQRRFEGLTVMSSGFLRIAIVLGLISAIGPFAIDMYLPALPTIGGRCMSGQRRHARSARW